MAQHDYTIANQGFPAFRSDLNDALAAIVSNNSGASEPTTMFAHQLWVDTAADPSVLKIRNADNDAWITIGTINQTGDTFTLTSAVSATTLNTSGLVVFNDAGADVDFRVEGDTDANLLFVDASTDRVGVGTGSPAVKLDVSGTLAVRNASTSYINTYCSGGGNRDYQIGVNGSAFVFNDITSGTSERARITSGNNLLLGTTSAIGSRQELIIGGNAGGTLIGLGRGGTNKGRLELDSADNLYLQNTASASIYVIATTNGVVLTNGATAWASASDERKKDIIEPIENAAEKVSSLRAVIGKYKTDDEDKRRAFLIAQDVQAVLPEAVEEDKDGDLLLMYTDTIPLLVAAIKELKAELDTVKAELVTLKGQ